MKKVVKSSIIKWLIIFSMTTIMLILINISMVINGTTLLKEIGSNGLLVLMIGALIIYILRFHHNFVVENNKVVLYITIFMLITIPIAFLTHTIVPWIFPVSIASMIISLMIDEGLGVITNIVITCLLALVGQFQLEFVLFFVISGTYSCLFIGRAKERKKIFYVSVAIVTLNMLLFVLISMISSVDALKIDLEGLLLVTLNGVLSVIITVGSLPLLETLFHVTTNDQLLELTASNQKLLQRLMLEAPGTFHHSQMVAQLSETAATDIGANPLLARTGALYHDVGKLKNPQLFIENQNGVNPHDELAPDNSATIIISHVSDGIKLANEHKLPKQIIHIIKEHQGNSLVKFFYNKAKEHSDGFAIEQKDFMYLGPKPQTNEAAIVMLADCVEAYVRAESAHHNSIEEIETMIHFMLHNKLEDGQLDECPLKIKELPIIANAFRKVYNGMYHDRVTYTKE